MQKVARWESKNRKYWVELRGDGYGYMYISEGAGGNLGSITLDQALSVVEEKVRSGYFLLGSYRTSMRRVE